MDATLGPAFPSPTAQHLRLLDTTRGFVESQVLGMLSVMACDLAFADVLVWTIEKRLDPGSQAPAFTVEKVTEVFGGFTAPEAVWPVWAWPL